MQRKLLFSFGVVLLVGLVLVGAWFGWRQMQKIQPLANQNSPTTEAVQPPDPDGGTARCQELTEASLQERCKNFDYVTVVTLTAVENKDSQWCQRLTTPANQDQCLIQVAAASQDETLCQRVAEDSRQRCLSNFIQQTDDFARCAQLADAAATDACQYSIVSKNAQDEKWCSQLTASDNRDKCYEYWYTFQARRSVDYTLCKKITRAGGEQRCLQLLPVDSDGDLLDDYTEQALAKSDPTKADTDGDGLTDYEEYHTYHTDPTKADTDGDGYSDGIEIKNGHDPLKR